MSWEMKEGFEAPVEVEQTEAVDGWEMKEGFEAPVTPTPVEEKGPIGKAMDWISTPANVELPEYQTTMAESLKAEEADKTANLAEVHKLDQEANTHRKQSFKDETPSELEETSWYDLNDKAYTTKSLAGYYNKRESEAKSDGTYTNKSQFKVQMYNELKAKGATTLDLQELGQVSRGIKTGEEMFGDSYGNAVAAIPKILEERGIDPFTNQARQNGLAMASLVTDVVSLYAPLLPDAWDAETKIKNQEASILEAQAVEAGIQKAYEDEYGSSVVQMVQSATELIPLMLYNPVGAAGKISWSRLAFADSFYANLDAKRSGYDSLQAGAHGVIAAGVTGAIGKVSDIGVELYRAAKGLDEFKTIASLPRKYQIQVRELQKINGWSDDEVMSMVRGYKNGLEEGKLNAVDSIRLMAQNSHHPEARELFEKSILYNRTSAKAFLKESTTRSQDFLKTISKKSDLGQILLRNQYNKYGSSSLDWANSYDMAVKKGINEDSTVMRLLKRNADMFDDFDINYHKSLVKKGMGEEKSMVDNIGDVAGQITEAYVGRHVAALTKTAYFMSMSIPKFVTKLMAKMLPASTKSEIGDTIAKSFAKGNNKLNPITLKAEIKKGIPNTPDHRIDDIVEEIIKSSQISARTKTRQDAARIVAQKESRAQSRIVLEGNKVENELGSIGLDVDDLSIVADRGTKKYNTELNKVLRAEKISLAKLQNKVNDMKLTGDVKKDARKIAKVVNSEAVAIRKSAEKRGVSMSIQEAKEISAQKIDDIIARCS